MEAGKNVCVCNIARYYFLTKSHLMNISKIFIGISAFSLCFMAACKPYDPDGNYPPKEVEGWVPIYAKKLDVNTTGAKSIENGGKIYIKGKILFQIETGKGIHVINISDPSNPEKIKFIEIAGCQEMAMMGNTLYANSVNDLVSINLADLENITVTNRIENAFHMVNKYHPPVRGWFECIDPSKGEVVGWEMKTLYSPKCLY